MIPNVDLQQFLMTVGYLGIFLIVFAESGLLIGFFLPGDSLLFTAGILAAAGFFNLPLLVLIVVIAAITGDQVGYQFGRHTGPRIFNREDSLLFHKKNLYAAQAFYEKHGGKTIILARFMPIVRTFAPVVAGAGEMKYGRFTFFNVIGGILWGAGVTIAGYFLGSLIPDIDRYLLPIIALIVLASITPPLWHFWKDENNRTQVIGMVKQKLGRAPETTTPPQQPDAE